MRLTSVVVVCLAVTAVAAFLPAYGPLQLSYVTSESMEPTLETGEGYVIHRTTDVAVGDVVTFRSATDDEHVTHRLVGVTDDGYVTQGDNNPSTDQAGGEPPVTEAALVGRAVTVGGSPLTVPHLQLVATTVAAYRVPLGLLVGVALLLAGTRSRGRRTRDVVSASGLFHGVLALALVSSCGLLLATEPTGTATYVVVADSRAETTLQLDEPAVRNETFAVPALPFVERLVRVEGATLVHAAPADENGTVALQFEVPAQGEIGPHDVTVRFVRYPAGVPAWLVGWLYDRHAVLAALLTAAVVYLPLYLAYEVAVDGRAAVRTPRSRTLARWFE